MTQAWYPFYWSDYSGKTLHLSQGQHGAYMLLLRYIYTAEKPISHSARYSIAMAMLDQERINVDCVLEEFFERRGDFWHSKRAEEIINEAKEKHERRVNSGAKGGIAKSSNARAMLDKKPSKALARGRISQPQPQPDTISAAKAASPPLTPLPEWLPADIWNAYLAMRKKKRAIPTDEAITLIIGKLEIWRTKGHDPSDILAKSITSNWTDIYEPKENHNENTGRNNSVINGTPNQQGATRTVAEQQPSKWQVAGQRVIDKIERGEI